MVFLRGHYIIDLFAGVIFGHYFWILAERYSYIIDDKILRIPLMKRFPSLGNKCESCSNESIYVERTNSISLLNGKYTNNNMNSTEATLSHRKTFEEKPST